LVAQYTQAELEGIYRQLFNLPQFDVRQFKKSVQQELHQEVTRPIDIKETFPRLSPFSAGPLVVTNLSANIAQPTAIEDPQGRMLIVRGFSVSSLDLAPAQVRINILDTRIGTDRLMARTLAPAAGVVVGGPDVFTQVVFSLLPIVLYPFHSLRVEFTNGVAQSMEIAGDFYGEECDFPLRSFGT